MNNPHYKHKLKLNLGCHLNKRGIEEIVSKIKNRLSREREKYIQTNLPYRNKKVLADFYSSILQDAKKTLEKIGIPEDSSLELRDIFETQKEFKERTNYLNKHHTKFSQLETPRHPFFYTTLILGVSGGIMGAALGREISDYIGFTQIPPITTKTISGIIGSLTGFILPFVIPLIQENVPTPKRRKIKKLHQENIEIYIRNIEDLIARQI